MRESGTVKWFDDSKGFGWIQPDDGGEDVFFHFQQIQGELKSLEVGQRVEYYVSHGPKGEHARDIIRL